MSGELIPSVLASDEHEPSHAVHGSALRVDETAITVMREHGRTSIWYGDPDLICEISRRAGCKQGHPLNRSAAVMQAVARSKRFRKDGYITHLGRRYNCYSPNEKADRSEPASAARQRRSLRLYGKSASAGGGEVVNHPMHYGDADDPYESIKVIEAWKLGFHLGNTVKYISRAERKGAPLQDLKKAAWYLAREIERRGRQRQNEGDELRAGGNLNKHD